ncbi:MAG: T9SS type A sorting domain-containing protein [Phycisphaerales bacterium]|nr:T9SS type A sorting domain-containing protein [Phycisphaerales bacterium]
MHTKIRRKFILFSINAILLCGINAHAQTTIIDSFLHDGIYRSYRIYIPAINDGTKKVPLIFNLHGLSSNGYEQENYGDFRPIADTANFIIVSPNGINVAPTPYNGWNTFVTIGTGTDDLGFINRLLDTAAKRYSINLNRVYATGMSNGGFMSYELACFMSSRITAIASVAGSVTAERRTSCNALHATPIMQIHGTADKTVGYDGTNYLTTIPGFTHIDSLMQYWVKYNACGSTASKTILPNISTTDSCTAEHYVWSGGKESSSVELFKIIGGGHTWPGSAFRTGVTNKDFSASKEIWRFFSQYSLDQFSLGIPSNNLSIELLGIYPNPAKDILHVRLSNPNRGEVTLQFSDLMGRALWQLKTTEDDVQIPCDTYPSGIYLMSIRNEHSTSVHKIIVE